MFKHFLKTTLRNLIKNKNFVIINVLGLGIALACAIMVYNIFKFNIDFDGFHTNRDIIYKVSITKEVNGNTQKNGITPLSLKPAIGNSINGIDNIVRFNASNISIRYKENIFRKKIGFVDDDFFEVFDFPIIDGNKNSIKDKSNILISEKLAKILFKDEYPIGKTILLYEGNKEEPLNVSGILKDIPMNSSMQFDALCLIEKYIYLYAIQEYDWQDWIAATFLKVSDKGRISAINNQLNSFVSVQNDQNKDWLIKNYYTERLKDLPLSSSSTRNYWLWNAMHPSALYLVGILGFIILLLACLNFMNTSLAISSRRLKEIGINKVLGGTRRFIILQFMGENIVLCSIALFFSLTIAPFLYEGWCSMFSVLDFKMISFNNIQFGFFLIALLLITSIVAGIYPSLYITSFSPVKILNRSANYKAGGLFSKILLALQFFLTTLCIVAAIVFIQNAYYQDNLDLGYNIKNIITVPVSDRSKLDALKSRIIQNPLINKIGVSKGHVQWSYYSKTLTSADQEQEVEIMDIGNGYFECMGFQLKEGRYFDQEFMESERGKAVIVNEKLMEAFGWKTAVGQRLRLNDTTEFKVIGVMKDFYLKSFYNKTGPVMFKLGMKDQMDIMVVNANIENLEKVNSSIKKEWEQNILNAPYAGFYQTERNVEIKQTNMALIKILLFLGLISIFLSMVGLYSMVSLNIIKRTKAIGVHKVFGAPMFKIVRAINNEFIYIVLIGSILGSLIGAASSISFLNSIYAYHIDINIVGVIAPVICILIISIITSWGKVYKAANLNPVDSLKYE